MKKSTFSLFFNLIGQENPLIPFPYCDKYMKRVLLGASGIFQKTSLFDHSLSQGNGGYIRRWPNLSDG